jgi:hypothetical protein
MAFSMLDSIERERADSAHIYTTLERFMLEQPELINTTNTHLGTLYAIHMLVGNKSQRLSASLRQYRKARLQMETDYEQDQLDSGIVSYLHDTAIATVRRQLQKSDRLWEAYPEEMRRYKENNPGRGRPLLEGSHRYIAAVRRATANAREANLLAGQAGRNKIRVISVPRRSGGTPVQRQSIDITSLTVKQLLEHL